MFRNLVESGSHGQDFRRRGKFFLATLVFYSALLVAAGIGSIYAYNVRLEDRHELELMTMMRFPAAPPKAEPERPAEPKPSGGGSPKAQPVTVPEVARLTPYGENRQLAREDTPVVARGVPIQIGPTTIIPPEIGTPGDGRNNGNNVGGSGDGKTPVLAPTEDVPKREPVEPEPTPKVEKPQGPVRLPSSVISGKAISKPAPAYPQLAIMSRASGTVAVQILIDERGRVISAQATSGHPLLLQAAVQAARRAQFSPTLLSNQPVKVSGVIYYNFVLR
jgi:protein TonB